VMKKQYNSEAQGTCLPAESSWWQRSDAQQQQP